MNKLRSWLGGSLRRQLTVSFLIISVAILSLSTWFTYHGVLQLLQKRTENSTVQLFQQAEFTINGFRAEVDKISKTLLVDEDVNGFMEAVPSNNSNQADEIVLKRAIAQKFTALLQNYEFLHSIYLFTEDGRVLGTTISRNTTTLSPQEIRERYTPEFYEAIKLNTLDKMPKLVWAGGIKASLYDHAMNELDHESEDGRYLISAARGIKARFSGKMAGTVVMNVKEDAVTDLFANLSLERGGDVYLADANGQVIAHPNRMQIGTQSDVFSHFTGMSYGSLEVGNKEVVYFPMASNEWTLMKSVPVSEFRKDIFTLYRQLIIVVVIGILLAMILSSMLIRRITKPLVHLSAAMSAMENGDLNQKVPVDDRNEWGVLSRGFNRMSQSIQGFQRLEQEKRYIEVQNLYNRINPHFLFNTLSTIRWMAAVLKASNIEQIITALGNLLKPVYSDEKSLSTIREEIELVRNYMHIMNARYGEGILWHVNLPETLAVALIPKFTLQPIIENSIQHGLMHHNHMGSIEIDICKDEASGSLEIRIMDTGCGIPEDRLEELHTWINQPVEEELVRASGDQFGIGLRNTNRRLKLLFGSHYGMRLESEESKWTVVIVRIPIQIEGNS
ncbi:hypothetical protein A8709_14305 [Paenibacillus pectinilyticus]|uniref:HAMP domain-containing protein n=1 Tax=Paenibacillus pectinilyticus TaxID=512399 RepID=A0A1C1A3X9_9BACL|nr:sensor histidine kinase [Paenibacillus pectinilyticus]OCT15267.1 hypothetical protein A8709_14305 [Paenibacillus pectinilyticus]